MDTFTENFTGADGSWPDDEWELVPGALGGGPIAIPGAVPYEPIEVWPGEPVPRTDGHKL